MIFAQGYKLSEMFITFYSIWGYEAVTVFKETEVETWTFWVCLWFLVLLVSVNEKNLYLFVVFFSLKYILKWRYNISGDFSGNRNLIKFGLLSFYR